MKYLNVRPPITISKMCVQPFSFWHYPLYPILVALSDTAEALVPCNHQLQQGAALACSQSDACAENQPYCGGKPTQIAQHEYCTCILWGCSPILDSEGYCMHGCQWMNNIEHWSPTTLVTMNIEYCQDHCYDQHWLYQQCTLCIAQGTWELGSTKTPQSYGAINSWPLVKALLVLPLIVVLLFLVAWKLKVVVVRLLSVAVARVVSYE